MNTRSPLQCPLHSALGDNPPGDPASAHGLVDWAGLPVDLDMAFSRRQRDKVYVQHLMRKREAQLRRDGQLCVCGIAADHGRLDPDAAESMSGR
ncbi:hypothetical protein [Mycobacterium sp.]|uniref:hypothetical protein n=1 Tax=Mycobacterium sp. TaxID=1785 RepID=UPI003C7507D4